MGIDMPPWGSLADRFERKYIPEPNSGCWLWDGCYSVETKKYLYGSMRNLRGKMEHAHRISWRLHRGEIPPGMQVLHKCDVSLCVNPDHLFLGTHTDNMLDMSKKGRAPHGEKNWSAKLTEEIVRQVRASKETSACWAQRLRVDQSTISLIRSGKRWGHSL